MEKDVEPVETSAQIPGLYLKNGFGLYWAMEKMEKNLAQFFTPEVAAAAGCEAEKAHLDPTVTGLAYDSRRVEPGNCYFALTGGHYDGHDFAGEAARRGAALIVHQHDLAEYYPGVVYLRAKDSRFAMSPIAAAFYGFPSRRLRVIGVTGTEGKSTTVSLIYQLLKHAGARAGFVSTVQFDDGAGEQWNPEHQTTPEAVTLHRLLARMVESGAAYAVLESSSHGLSPKTNRLGDVAFTAGVLTNVTHEHLEFHGTWEQYRADKANLFRRLDAGPEEETFGVVNGDDPSAGYFQAATNRPTYTYSVRGAAADFCSSFHTRNAEHFSGSAEDISREKPDLALQSLESSAEGNRYTVYIRETGETAAVRDCLPGGFNAGNVLASLLTVSRLLAAPVRELIPLVPLLKPVRGRMTTIRQGQPFEVLVDFAHTPSSFQAVLPPLAERLSRHGGRLITLFGSAGERDTKKRREQGRIAAEWSAVVMLTDEDPRGEKGIDIIEEIAQGIPNRTPGEDLFLIPDRPTAIRKAFSLARPGDAVVLLGKGHENSIIYADGARPYDEITEAEHALTALGYTK